MASQTIVQTLRIHGDFIKRIYDAVGDQPFTAEHLATLGVDIPPGVCLSRFRNAGIFTLVGRGGRSQSHLATLAERPGILCGTGGDSVILVLATPEEARELLGLSTRQTEILRPQTSGPCVHYDELSEYVADAYPCTYPYGDGICPHLDNPDIICPVKDACSAMSEVARMRDVCEAEQDEQDADMAAVAPSQTYETAAPEWVEPEPDDGVLHTYTVPATRKPTNPNAWSDEEIEVIRRAQSAAEAGRLYVDAFPESHRTVAAVSSRWYRLRAAGELIEPEPEEPDITVPHPTFRPGDRVRITHALHRGQTGKIERYFPATENYLVAIDGMPDMIVLTDAQMEAV